MKSKFEEVLKQMQIISEEQISKLKIIRNCLVFYPRVAS